MYELVRSVLKSDENIALGQLLSTLSNSGKRYLLRNEILQAFADYCHQSQKPAHFYHSSAIGKLLHHTHEIILEDDSSWFVVRPWIGSQEVWRIAKDLSSFDSMTPKALLDVRDRLVNHYRPQILEIDVSPFYESSPQIGEARNIGQGLAFLNHYLCDKLFTEPEYWLEALFQVLHQHQQDGIQLLINGSIRSGSQLLEKVKQAISFIKEQPPEDPYEKFHTELQLLGFEPGWGNTATRVRETLELFNRLIDTPEPAILEAFVSRIPATFRIVLISIHGWVGQEDVLGKTETMGQVVYVLDSARNLENKLREDIKLAGLEFLGIKPQVVILTRLIPNCEGTQCNLRLEKVEHTENAWILRVPFQEYNPQVTDNWISRYEIWPYLESFALDAEKELLALLGGKPNLIVGNYSDGNLVAFLLARSLNVTHCNIAHSLEKPKHLFSNLYWQESEEEYHFSVQFTADLINMNAADFTIASSYQEIVGTPDTVGMYESYKCFTMPELYHVVDGIDLFSPKFNMVPPGVNENVFFPYTHKERNSRIRTSVHNLLFTDEAPYILGNLDNPKKRPIFAFSPITSVKNLSGLAEWFGKSQELQERCNLIIITSHIDLEQSDNPEEVQELEKLREIIAEYHLHNHIRWIGKRLTPEELGEAYRVIADEQGIFIHFARFEAFGITILEAMISGLPTFATQFGGASEIIQDGENGFLINPTDLEGTANKILHFIKQCETQPQYWYNISELAIRRIHERYNWQLHTKQLLLLAKIYTFWKYVYRNNREALLRYLEALFYLLYKPRAEQILEQHMQR